MPEEGKRSTIETAFLIDQIDLEIMMLGKVGDYETEKRFEWNFQSRKVVSLTLFQRNS